MKRSNTNKKFDAFFGNSLGISKEAARQITNLNNQIVDEMRIKYETGEKIPEHWKSLFKYKGFGFQVLFNPDINTWYYTHGQGD